MANCFSARKQPPPLSHQLCSRLIFFILHPEKAFEFVPQSTTVVEAVAEQHAEDVQVCACRLLSASGTFLQFCCEQDSATLSLKPSFKAALSSGPSFDAQIYSDNCMKLVHLAFAPGTAVRLTAAILDAVASSPRPLFIFSLLKLKQHQFVHLLHCGHPCVRAAVSRLLIVTLSSSAAHCAVLNGLGPSDASRTLCRLLAMSGSIKHAVQVIASLLHPNPSPSLLNFFLSQRLLPAMCTVLADPCLHSALLETLLDCMAKLTSSFEEARRVIIDYCEEQAGQAGSLVDVALGHTSSPSSCLRRASTNFLLSMSRSPLAIRSVFVDACAAPVLLSLLSGPYFDEAIRHDLVGEPSHVPSALCCASNSFSYSAAVMAIISNCLLPLSTFRDVFFHSEKLVSLVCRCSLHSKDPALKTNSLRAMSSMMASQRSRELKIGILAKLDINQFLSTLESGDELQQQLCLLVLRNCADGPVEDAGAVLKVLTHFSRESFPDCKSHFSEFCFGSTSSNACECVRNSEEVTPSSSSNLKNCMFHDCPAEDASSTSCFERCAQVRRCLACIVRFCCASSSTTVEQLLLLLANIAAGSSGRKALVLDVLQPSFMADALNSDEDLVRRVGRFLRTSVCYIFSMPNCIVGGTLAFEGFEFKRGAIGAASAARLFHE
jgi:hypothetical protein